jgi:hypothetical protein
MNPLLLFALGNLKHDLGVAWDWLTHASFWQLVSLGLAGLSLMLFFQREDARHDARSWQKQYTQIHTQLEAISSKRDTQKQTTAENVKVVTRVIHDADGRAKVVEQAPIPPTDCHGVTPSGVLQADV